MRAGAALVATRRAAIPEINEEGVNGLFVEERNADDLAEKILRLVNDTGLREQMGRNNRQKYAGYFTERHFGQRITAVFDALSQRLRKNDA
jgi:glycosyltransferase involved in cell wall biosynthesis